MLIPQAHHGRSTLEEAQHGYSRQSSGSAGSLGQKQGCVGDRSTAQLRTPYSKPGAKSTPSQSNTEAQSSSVRPCPPHTYLKTQTCQGSHPGSGFLQTLLQHLCPQRVSQHSACAVASSSGPFSWHWENIHIPVQSPATCPSTCA